MSRALSRTTAAAVAAAALLALAAPAAAGERNRPLPPPDAIGPVETLVSYDPTRPDLAESVAIDRDGTVYVSLITGGVIDVLEPDGERRTITLPVGPGGSVGTLAVGRNETLYASSFTPPALWRVDAAGTATKLTDLPEGAQPNGITFDRYGNLYAADSALGTVWRLAPGATEAEPWVVDDLLAPDPDGITIPGAEDFPVPGANGVKVFAGRLYVSNSSTATILRIPLRRDGRPGPVEVAYRDVVADDFAFDVLGNLYVTTDPFDTVDRVRPDGTLETLLTAEDGLSGPSAVAFGTRHGERTELYITNLALFDPADPRPSLQRVDVGVPGLPVPVGPGR
ncbi:MAG TPA: hypothetical protein VD813_07955 [Pseudonocardia sp.]|nr:hypothetical protein [Pseudonocardia sp.]